MTGYAPPKRDLRPASTPTPEIEITSPNEEMGKSWNVVKKLNPTPNTRRSSQHHHADTREDR